MEKDDKVTFDIIEEYKELLDTRERLSNEIREIDELLGLNPRKIETIDDLAKEEERIVKLANLYEEIKESGNVFIVGEKKKIGMRLNELAGANVNVNDYELQPIKEQLKDREEKIKAFCETTVKIYSLRQGILNIADTENSVLLSEDFKNRYGDAQEFITQSSIDRMEDFITAYNNDMKARFPIAETSELMTINEKEATNNIVDSLPPMLKLFYTKTKEINEKTGYASGEYIPIPLEFDVGRIEGEIIINEPQRTKFFGKKEMAEASLSLETKEVKGIPKFLAEKFPGLWNIIEKMKSGFKKEMQDKENGER